MSPSNTPQHTLNIDPREKKGEKKGGEKRKEKKEKKGKKIKGGYESGEVK
jgi:hypothetical protein